jgi:hypothetical protein
MAASIATELRGRIAATNDKGLKLEGGDKWLDWSKYGKVDKSAAQVGADAAVEIDGRGFIRDLTILNDPVPALVRGGSGELPSKDMQIIRESALKAAVAFCSSRPT